MAKHWDSYLSHCMSTSSITLPMNRSSTVHSPSRASAPMTTPPTSSPNPFPTQSSSNYMPSLASWVSTSPIVWGGVPPRLLCEEECHVHGSRLSVSDDCFDCLSLLSFVYIYTYILLYVIPSFCVPPMTSASRRSVKFQFGHDTDVMIHVTGYLYVSILCIHPSRLFLLDLRELICLPRWAEGNLNATGSRGSSK